MAEYLMVFVAGIFAHMFNKEIVEFIDKLYNKLFVDDTKPINDTKPEEK